MIISCFRGQGFTNHVTRRNHFKEEKKITGSSEMLFMGGYIKLYHKKLAGKIWAGKK